MTNVNKIQLNAPAGTLPSLMAAVDAGADSVYLGFASATNLRNLPGLNFSVAETNEGVQYAHRHGVRVYITVNTHPMDYQLEECFRAVDNAQALDADAVIAADLAILEYASNKHPDLDIHLSCIAGAADPDAIRFYSEEFGVKCVILPRVLSIEQIAALRNQTDVLLEVLVFGVLCANYDGRCCLSSFITGVGAHSNGACAPVEFVQFEETAEDRLSMTLNGVIINEYAASEKRAYPTPCKGKYYNQAMNGRVHAFQDPCSLNALPLLGKLAASGVDIIKIEGRQRSLQYVGQTTRVWRGAIDALDGSRNGINAPEYENGELDSLLEGMASTVGALDGD